MDWVLRINIENFKKENFKLFYYYKDWKTFLWGFQNGAKHPCSPTWADLVYISIWLYRVYIGPKWVHPGHPVPVYTGRDGHRIFFIKTNIPHSGTWVNELLQKISKQMLSLAVQGIHWTKIGPSGAPMCTCTARLSIFCAFFVKAYLLMFLNEEYLFL